MKITELSHLPGRVVEIVSNGWGADLREGALSDWRRLDTPVALSAAVTFPTP